MMVDVTLHEAAQSDIFAVDRALKAGHRNFEQTDDDELTPLQWAASAGTNDVCDRLIRNGAVADWTDDADEWTPLHHAAMGGHTETVQLLLELKANPKVVCNNKGTALHRACEQGHLEIVRCLLAAGLDPDAVDGDLDSPLHLAACGLDRRGHPDVVECLLEHGANPHMKNKSKRIASKITKNGDLRTQLQRAEDEWESAGKPTNVGTRFQADSVTQTDVRNKLSKRAAALKPAVVNVPPQSNKRAAKKPVPGPSKRPKVQPAKPADRAKVQPAKPTDRAKVQPAKPKTSVVTKAKPKACSQLKKPQPQEKARGPTRHRPTRKAGSAELILELEADSPIKDMNTGQLIAPASADRHLENELKKEALKREKKGATEASEGGTVQQMQAEQDSCRQQERQKRDQAAEVKLQEEDKLARHREAARADAKRAADKTAAEAAPPTDSWYAGCIMTEADQVKLAKEKAATELANQALADSAEKHLAWETSTTSEGGRAEQLSRRVFRTMTEVSEESIPLATLRDRINSQPQMTDSVLLFGLNEVRTAVNGHTLCCFLDEDVVYKIA